MEINYEFQGDSTRVRSLCFHPNDPLILSGLECGNIELWNYVKQNAFYDLLSLFT